MKQLFLYLDESGNFESDSSLKDNPSLVGGVLSYDEEISASLAKELLGSNFFHSVEIPPNEFSRLAFPILKQIKTHGCDMVIFENKERLEVVDGDTTYLNIISEGIIQLLEALLAEYGKIKLNIVVAVRKAVNREDYKSGYIIDRGEYIKRLQEKIIVGLARKTNSSVTKDSWNLDFKSAKTDYRLMLADVVCHSWFRKNKKFTNEQRREIEALYQGKYVFSVFPNDLDVSFQKMLYSGNIGDLIFEVMSTCTESKIGTYIKRIINGLRNLNDYSREIQLQILFNKLMHLYHVDWNQNLILKTVARLKKYFIKELELNNIAASKFLMDIYLLSCTIATHKGDISQAEEEIKKCETILPTLVKRWESLDYYFIYYIRKGVHLLNSYDASGCIRLMNELEDTIDNNVILFQLTDRLNKACAEMKSDFKGKILGTRLLARINLIKVDINQQDLARNESDKAINEFAKNEDINRQYQYRCRIEYEVGNYNEALAWLFKSLEVKAYDDLDQLIKSSLSANKQVASFSLMHYACIMAEAYMAGEVNIAKNMHNTWNKNKVNEYLMKVENPHHPYEIIYWKLATLLMSQGNIRAAMETYHLAMRICDREPRHQALKAISLGIKAEIAAFLINNCDSKAYQMYYKNISKDLVNSFNNLMNSNIPNTMVRHFKSWRPLIEKIKNHKELNIHRELLKLSKQVYY